MHRTSINYFSIAIIHKFISTIFCLETRPEIIFTAENGALKYLASAEIIATFACPLTGGSLTQTSKFVSLNFLILSLFELGLAFTNIFILENHLKDTSVVLVVGMRVAQIAFYQVDLLTESYSTSGGQYQTTDDTEKMIKNWSPYLMLPKFNRDNY